MIIRKKGFPTLVKTFERKIDAYAWAQDVQSAMRGGRFIDPRKAEGMNVGELIDAYIDATFHQRRSPQTPRQTLAWWKGRIGDIAIGHVSKQLIKQHWGELERAPSARTKKLRSARTLNAYLENISACFSFAVDEEWIEANPILRVKKKPLNNSRNVVLSLDQLTKLLEEAGKSKNRYLKVALLITLSTGGRRGEVMRLTWNDINLATGEVRFRVTKNGEPRTVVLGKAALEAVKAHSKLRAIGSPLLFPPRKHRGLPDRASKSSPPWEDLRSPFRTVCKKAGIGGLRWHDLRHCAASYLLSSGATVPEMMKILGHKSPAMSWRYSHLDQKRTSELVEKVDSIFLTSKAA